MTVREIERELARLRDASTDLTAAPRLRTSVMTHIAWVPEAWAEAAKGTLAGLAERHPSRTILLFPRPDDAEDRLEGEVDLRCFVRGGEQKEVCTEVISLELHGARARVPASIVTPLLVSDLPVFVRWRGQPPFGASELEQLVGVADRLVVDSAEWNELPEAYVGLAALFDRIAVSDIAWTRTEPWREAVALLWPGVGAADSVRVAGPRADALLLRGWLTARLRHELELEHEPAAALERVKVGGFEARPERLEPKTASDLLSDQLELFSRDRIYEQAVAALED